MFRYEPVYGNPFQVIVYHDDFVLPMLPWCTYLEGKWLEIVMLEDDRPAFLFEFPTMKLLFAFLKGCRDNME